MRHLELRDWLIFALCLLIIALSLFFNWATLEDLPPLFFTLDFQQPNDFLNSLAVAGPIIILILTLSNFKFRPAFVFLAALATLVPFVWYVGNLSYTSLTAEFALNNDRLWLLRLVSIAFWVQLAIAVLLLILGGWGLMDRNSIEEAGVAEIQSV